MESKEEFIENVSEGIYKNIDFTFKELNKQTIEWVLEKLYVFLVDLLTKPFGNQTLYKLKYIKQNITTDFLYYLGTDYDDIHKQIIEYIFNVVNLNLAGTEYSLNDIIKERYKQ